jgi:hypothetical protein
MPGHYRVAREDRHPSNIAEASRVAIVRARKPNPWFKRGTGFREALGYAADGGDPNGPRDRAHVWRHFAKVVITGLCKNGCGPKAGPP